MSQKTNYRIVKPLPAGIIACLLISSCTTVKEYQKNKLNDAEMTLGNRKIEKTEMSFQSYREGVQEQMPAKQGVGAAVINMRNK